MMMKRMMRMRTDIKTIEAHSAQLFLSDSADIHSLLARAMADVPHTRGHNYWRISRGFPGAFRQIGPPVEHCDLEPEASKSWLAGRALICNQCHTCQCTLFSELQQMFRGAPVYSSIQDQQVLSQCYSMAQQLLQVRGGGAFRGQARQELACTAQCGTSS